MACPVFIGTPPGVIDHLAKIGPFIYGENLSVVLSPTQKISYPGLAVVDTLFTPGTGAGGAANVTGFAIRPDETCLVVERIPSGTTSNGNVGPLTAYYRIDPDGTVTTIATGGLSIASGAAYSSATDEFYTRQLTGPNAWYEVDINTGSMTSVVTGFGSEVVVAADGAIWASGGGSQVQRWMPTGTTVQTISVPSYTSNPIPVGTGVWIPQLLATGYQVNANGTITAQPCMTGFPAMFSGALDLLDTTISICIDSSPLDLYEIVVVAEPNRWDVQWS